MHEINRKAYEAAVEKHMGMLNQALDGVELTKEEERFVGWIAGLDLHSVQMFCQIVEKKERPHRPASLGRSNN